VDLLLPDVRLAKVSPRLIDNTGRFNSPLAGTLRTVSRPGDRWGVRLDYSNLIGVDRARMESFVANQRGAANRIFFSPVVDFPGAGPRGSFPSSELFANNNFASGTTGWTTEGNFTLTAADRVIRNTRTKSDGTLAALVGLSRSATLTQFLPYLVRFFTRQGRGRDGQTFYNNGSPPDGLTGQASGIPWIKSNYGAYGLLWGVRVPGATGSYNFGTFVTNATGVYYGDYYDVLWSSVSQCALVDGGQNLLLWSDDFTNAAWTKVRSSTSLSAVRAPDGTLTADSLVEDTTSNTHYVHQTFAVSSAAQDICITIAANSSSRNWLALNLIEGTGGTGVIVYFNTATGAIGTSGTGANWANLRSYTSSLGGGWYQLTLVARKTNAATSIDALILLASADNTDSYTGTGTNGLQIWRATVGLSSTPVRLMQSASAAVAATTQSGSALYTKGWPVSTSGLLLPGDWIEINTELKRVTASVDSNGSGLAYLQFSPPMRNPPSDNDPVVINSPMGRFVLSAQENGWSTVPGYFATSSLDLVEAPQ
jgi:hypothetical protein